MTNSTTNQNGSVQNERAKVTGDAKMLPWWSKCEHSSSMRKTGYSTQLEEARNLFNSSNIRERAEQSGYLLDLAGKVAVLYREKIKLVPGKKPKRKRTFSREFELSSDGLKMMINFLILQEAVDKIPSQLLHSPKGNFPISL